MREKTAGIVTLYASQNFGAFLQSYAMQTVLERYGYRTEFLKYSSLDIQEFIFMVKTKNIRLALFRLKQYRKYLQSRQCLHIAKGKYTGEHLDLAVVGSDTLWDVQNPTIHPTEFYLGKGISAKKIIAYAPSANGTTAQEFTKIYKDSDPFDAFTAIGVRDHNTSVLVKEITGQLAPVVLDPTLLLDQTDYLVHEPDYQGKYVLVYGYSFTEEERAIICEEARKRSAKTISVGLLNTWCDENVSASVPEFLGYIKNAELIFTGTFHGTIFSMIMEKKFISFARKNYKVLDLLEKLGMESRNGSVDIVHCKELCKTEIDYFAFRELLQKLRKESLDYFEKAIM